jgi:D-ribose pyranose/furanose isomerase RbsD
MINKLEIIQEHLDNIQFHIDHVNDVLANPGLYPTPDNKNEVDLSQYLQNLESIKQALQAEKEALTNQG